MRPYGVRLVSGVVLLGLMLAAPGCHRYAYQELDSQLNAIDIDENAPARTVRWSKWWGQGTRIWSPTICGDGPQTEDCQNRLTYCTNKGIGKIDVRMRWYSIPALIATLGWGMPVEVTVYCRGTSPCAPDTLGP